MTRQEQEQLIEEFIRESNHIESEYTEQAFQEAMKAFKYIRGQNGLSKTTLLAAHRILMATRKLENRYKGAFRDIPVYIGGTEALKHTKIEKAMVDWFKSVKSTRSLEGVKKNHIEFEHIHPFVDGNGRIGRMVMLWQCVKRDLPITVIHEGKEQMEYYKWFK